jgi:hypothetical protein
MNELEYIYELLYRLKKNKENWNELIMESTNGHKAKYGLIPPGGVNLSDLHLFQGIWLETHEAYYKSLKQNAVLNSSKY